MDQIKVHYTSVQGQDSKAYVSDKSPHIGTDKYTGEPVEVLWIGHKWAEIRWTKIKFDN